MGSTTHHALRYPDTTTVMKPRVDITNLASDVDTKFPKITYGTGAAPTTGMRAGDIHLQHSATVVALDENAPLPDGE